MTPNTTISARGLSRSFRSVRAVDSLDLDIGPGITGFLGPNGAGKTTLLRIAATVMSPDRGELTLLGRDPARHDDRVEIRRRLGYVPQEPGFHTSFTAFEFVDYVAILKEMTERRARHAEVRRVLEAVGLSEVARKKIKALSGGMRRRVAIAQALLGSPELLVLDEPTAGLDPEQRLRFRELVTSLDPRTTTIISTHQTEDVAALCQRVLVMLGGTVRFDGAPHDLAASAAGHVWVADSRDSRAQLAWVNPDGRVRHIGEAPSGAELVEPTIEDAYLLLVGASASADVAA